MRKKRKHTDDEAEINITPMLDIVFIMLIFFIVTTSFVKEQGLEVSRPSATPPKEVRQEEGPIVVKIDANSLISIEGRILEPGAVQANLQRASAKRSMSPLVIAAHPDADTEALVTILDAAKAAEIHSVSVATSSL